ncbi:hypothetical protein BMT54_08160 [Pasteurellaceae bacterium 15-036681]|nr:hypothetical protein BMT54_08160 [Pasteurellaceae bacterium 15-036681]
MKKLILLATIGLSSIAYAGGAPFQVETSKSSSSNVSNVTITSRANDLVIENILVNREQCQLSIVHLPYSLGSDRTVLANLLEQAGLGKAGLNNPMTPDQMWTWTNFIKEYTHEDTFPVSLSFAGSKRFSYYCKGGAPILEISVETNLGAWSFTN